MSHYECKKCGEVTGETAGLCHGCYSPYIILLAKAVEDATKKAEYRFEKRQRVELRTYIANDSTVKVNKHMLQLALRDFKKKGKNNVASDTDRAKRQASRS